MAKIEEVKSLTEALKVEAKSGRISRAMLETLKPFIAVIRELADALDSFLDPPEPAAQEGVPAIATQNNVKSRSEKSNMVFEIITKK